MSNLRRVGLERFRPLVHLVPRGHRESPEQIGRRRRIVTATGAAGSVLLGLSLSRKPGSPQFYRLSLATAATWLGGGLAAGPLHLGRMWSGDQRSRRPVLMPVASAGATFGLFCGLAVAARRIPLLRHAITDALRYAETDSMPAVYTTALVNGIAEEVFFRGALYAAAPEGGQVAVSTAAYTAVTLATRNPALVAAAAVMGTAFGVQRRMTGGIQASILTHVTWSALMLRFLPAALGEDSAARGGERASRRRAARRERRPRRHCGGVQAAEQ